MKNAFKHTEYIYIKIRTPVQDWKTLKIPLLMQNVIILSIPRANCLILLEILKMKKYEHYRDMSL